MRTTKVYTPVITVLLIVLTLALGSCTRRTVDEEYSERALIPVRIDWSASGVPVAGMHRASVWLFPDDGSTPLEYRLESDLTYREIPVPVGVYSVLVFNETTDTGDWNGIIFTGKNRYETFAAMAIPDAVRGFYSRSEELPLIVNPEPLAAWSLNRFEVTTEMMKRTRAIARGSSSSYRNMLINEVPDLTVVKPLPRFERVQITAYITNLASSMQITGTINGMAAGVNMVSGEMVSAPAAHAFILNGRVYEDNEKDGTTTRTFHIFGRSPVPDAQHTLYLDCLLTDGTLHPRFAFDVTQRIYANTSSIVKTHIINLGFEIDDTIVLPELGVGAGISVDGWDEIIIPVM